MRDSVPPRIMATSNFLLDNSSLTIGEDVERREQAVDKLLDLLDQIGCPVYALEGEEAIGEVAFFDPVVHEIWINPEYLDDVRVVQILVHEMIHKIQYQFGWLKAQVEEGEIVIPDVGYRGSKQGWEEYLFSLGYDKPETGGYENPEDAFTYEVAAFLLMDSYDWFIEWFEAKYKDWVDFYTKLGIL